MPSGRWKGPEKSNSTRPERDAAPNTWSAVPNPEGTEGEAGCGGTPAALMLAKADEDHGKQALSKYTSDVTTMRKPGT
eukprot:6202807-Pleurochrysis_carterae.AAC.3